MTAPPSERERAAFEARRATTDPVEVPARVWLVVTPCVGTKGAIVGFRDAETARAFVGRGKPGVVIAGPFVRDITPGGTSPGTTARRRETSDAR